VVCSCPSSPVSTSSSLALAVFSRTLQRSTFSPIPGSACVMSEVAAPALAANLTVNYAFGVCSLVILLERLALTILLTCVGHSCGFCLYGLGDAYISGARDRVHMVVRPIACASRPSATLRRVPSSARHISPTKFPFLILRWYTLGLVLCVATVSCFGAQIHRSAASSNPPSPVLALTVVSFTHHIATDGLPSKFSRCRSVLSTKT
jgi:hypothetical protein